MAQYSMITSGGLNEVDDAHQHGTLIEIAYYVPVYDFRIDADILPVDTAITATPISTCTSLGDLYPQGEILWNIDSKSNMYQKSQDNNYLVMSGSELISDCGKDCKLIQDYAHKSKLYINTFNSTPISDYYRNDTMIAPNESNAIWVVSGVNYQAPVPKATSADGYGPEHPELPALKDLYGGVDFRKVTDTSGNNLGNYSVRVEIEKGDIKFNKVGLYAVKRSANGESMGNRPFLFAQATFPDTYVISAQGGAGLTSIQLNFKLDVETLNVDFDDISFSTSGDYWCECYLGGNVYGAQNNGSVYIGQKLAIDETGGLSGDNEFHGVSKLFVSTCSQINKMSFGAETSMPQLCLQHMDNVYEAGSEYTKRLTTFRTISSGGCEISLELGDSLDSSSKNIVPRYSHQNSFGNIEHKWSSMSLSDKFHIYQCSHNEDGGDTECDDGFILMETTSNKTIPSLITGDPIDVYKGGKFSNMNTYIGPKYNAGDTNNENAYYLYSNISNPTSYFLDPSLAVASLESKLIIRSNKDAYLIDINKKYVGTDFNTSDEIIDAINTSIDDETGIHDYLGYKKDTLIMTKDTIYTHGDMNPTGNVKHDLGSDDKVYNVLNTFAIKSSQGKDINEPEVGSTRQLKMYTNIVPGVEGLSIRQNTNTNSISDEWDEINAMDLGRNDMVIDAGFFKKLEVVYMDGLEDERLQHIGSENVPVTDIWTDHIHPRYCDLYNFNNDAGTWIKKWNAIWSPQKNFNRNLIWLSDEIVANQMNEDAYFNMIATANKDTSTTSNRMEVVVDIDHTAIFTVGVFQLVVGASYCALENFMYKILDLPTSYTFHAVKDENIGFKIIKQENGKRYVLDVTLKAVYSAVHDELTFKYDSITMSENVPFSKMSGSRVIMTDSSFTFTYNH